MATRPFRRLRRLCFLAGAAVSAAVLWAWQSPATGRESRVELSVHVNPTGELAVDPSGRVLDAAVLEPGRPVRLRLRLRNLTASPRVARLRAMAAGSDIDHVLHVRLTGPHGALYEGPLAGLRRRTARGLHLSAGRAQLMTAWLWVPQRSRNGFLGAPAPLTLELSSRKARP